MTTPTNLNLTLLAGLSMGTVLALKHSGPEDLSITFGGPDTKAKFSGWILQPNGRPVINTGAIFDSGDAAVAYMTSIVDTARQLPDLETLHQHVRNLSQSSPLEHQNPVGQAR
jgi:hypothetical protein